MIKSYKKTLAVAIAASIVSAGAVAQPFTKGQGPYSWNSLSYFENLDLSGQTVTVSGPWLAPEAGYFNDLVAVFEAATGADVQYAGSDSFEQQIVIDAQAGSPPNIAVFPQPGLAGDLAAQNLLVPIGDSAADYVRENFAAGQSWVDLGTYADRSGTERFYAVPFNVNVKSLVWYSPDNFQDFGYEVPNSMEELIALSDQMVADGNTPWCIGLGSGAATGWPATDWVEDFMLRLHSPDVYNGWVDNSVKFNDPRVVEAIELFGRFAKNPEYVSGGPSAVATTDFRASAEQIMDFPPSCFMHRQASFAQSFFEGDAGVDFDFFYFPPFAEKAEELGSPVLGGATLVAITRDSEATRAFYSFLQTPLAQELWMARGGFLTPHLGANQAAYASDTDRRLGEILINADVFGFDASDLMPGAIGTGTFWTGMVDFVGGSSAQQVTNAIQRSWDQLN